LEQLIKKILRDDEQDALDRKESLKYVVQKYYEGKNWNTEGEESKDYIE